MRLCKLQYTPIPDPATFAYAWGGSERLERMLDLSRYKEVVVT